VDQSLVRQQEGVAGEPRFTMLETIREYALERLQASADAATLAQQHTAYYLQAGQALTPDSAEEAPWLERMALEHDNLRAVLQRSLDHGDAETALQLGTALWWFWEMYGHWREGRRWLQAALAAGGDVAPATRMQALAVAGNMAWQQGDYTEATVLFDESLALSRALGDREYTAWTLMNLGKTALEAGDYDRATAALQESLAVIEQSGAELSIAGPLVHLGEIALDQADFAEAERLFDASLAASRAKGEPFFGALALRGLGETAIEQAAYPRALPLLVESLRLSREVRHPGVAAYALGSMAGAVAGQAGQRAEEVRRAACLWGAAERLREELGRAIGAADRSRSERRITAARVILDEATWTAAWAEGRAMTLEQAIAYALDPTPTFP
jgi:tetratricopeptide (TPR) repeat protein